MDDVLIVSAMLNSPTIRWVAGISVGEQWEAGLRLGERGGSRDLGGMISISSESKELQRRRGGSLRGADVLVDGRACYHLINTPSPHSQL